MLQRVIKTPFIAVFLALFYVLGVSCLQRIRGSATAFGWPAATLRGLELVLIGSFALLSILMVMNLFASND